MLNIEGNAIACWLENQKPPPGQLIDVGGYRLHLYVAGEASPTIILDHSLGGIEGYFLVEELAKIARICIYDRAGYGWSDRMPSNLHRSSSRLDISPSQSDVPSSALDIPSSEVERSGVELDVSASKLKILCS